jgi:hypothetical protein
LIDDPVGHEAVCRLEFHDRALSGGAKNAVDLSWVKAQPLEGVLHSGDYFTLMNVLLAPTDCHGVFSSIANVSHCLLPSAGAASVIVSPVIR